MTWLAVGTVDCLKVEFFVLTVAVSAVIDDAFAESADARADCSLTRLAFVVDRLELNDVESAAMFDALAASAEARVLASVDIAVLADVLFVLTVPVSVEIAEAFAESPATRALCSVDSPAEVVDRLAVSVDT